MALSDNLNKWFSAKCTSSGSQSISLLLIEVFCRNVIEIWRGQNQYNNNINYTDSMAREQAINMGCHGCQQHCQILCFRHGIQGWLSSAICWFMQNCQIQYFATFLQLLAYCYWNVAYIMILLTISWRSWWQNLFLFWWSSWTLVSLSKALQHFNFILLYDSFPLADRLD